MKAGDQRILLVSSQMRDVWPVALILTRLGHVVHVAAGGQDAIRKAKGPGFDLLVVFDPLRDIPSPVLFDKIGGHLQNRTLILTHDQNPELSKTRFFAAAREVVGRPKKDIQIAAIICENLIGWGISAETVETEKWVH